MQKLVLLLTLVLLGLGPTFCLAHPHILRAETGVEIPFGDLIENLARPRVIFLGESHDHLGHHQMQLAVIRALHQKGLKLAIGLEMIREHHQEPLDRWVTGELDEEGFLPIFSQDWEWWPAYREIFLYARQQGIKMVALNIPRQLTKQVAEQGFDSLPPEKVQELGQVRCVVDPAYEQFIRRALGNHAHQGGSFRNFCEAQLLWDTAMAENIAEFLHRHPETTTVVLAGSGHAWKHGIPAQLEMAADSSLVVLPEVAGRATRFNITSEDADYLWLDEGRGSWQP